jgi:hypothetical protein
MIASLTGPSLQDGDRFYGGSVVRTIQARNRKPEVLRGRTTSNWHSVKRHRNTVTLFTHRKRGFQMRKMLGAAAIAASMATAGQASACLPTDLNGIWVLDTVDLNAQKQPQAVHCELIIQNGMSETCNGSRLPHGSVGSKSVQVTPSLSQCAYTLKFIYYNEHTASLVSVSRDGDTASGIFQYKYGSTTDHSIFNMVKLQ